MLERLQSIPSLVVERSTRDLLEDAVGV